MTRQTALGAGRAQLARSYFPVQNAALSARAALRTALDYDDPELEDLARNRLRAMHREDLMLTKADARPVPDDGPKPTDGRRDTVEIRLLTLEVLEQPDPTMPQELADIGPLWRKTSETPRPAADALAEYERLIGALVHLGSAGRALYQIRIIGARLRAPDGRDWAQWRIL